MFSICLSFIISYYLDHYLSYSFLLYKFWFMIYLVHWLFYHLIRIMKTFIFRLNNHFDLNQFWTKCENWIMIIIVFLVKEALSILVVLILVISFGPFVRYWKILFSILFVKLCFRSPFVHLLLNSDCTRTTSLEE